MRVVPRRSGQRPPRRITAAHISNVFKDGTSQQLEIILTGHLDYNEMRLKVTIVAQTNLSRVWLHTVASGGGIRGT